MITDELVEAAYQAYRKGRDAALRNPDNFVSDHIRAGIRAALTAALSGSPQVEAGTVLSVLHETLLYVEDMEDCKDSPYDNGGARDGYSQARYQMAEWLRSKIVATPAPLTREQEGGEAPVAWANSEELREADLTIQKSARVYVRKRSGDDHLDTPLFAHPPLPADGWKLVPVEPTPEMLDNEDLSRIAIRAAMAIHSSELPVRSIWQAMLAAAPTPPASTEGGADA